MWPPSSAAWARGARAGRPPRACGAPTPERSPARRPPAAHDTTAGGTAGRAPAADDARRRAAATAAAPAAVRDEVVERHVNAGHFWRDLWVYALRNRRSQRAKAPRSRYRARPTVNCMPLAPAGRNLHGTARDAAAGPQRVGAARQRVGEHVGIPLRQSPPAAAATAKAPTTYLAYVPPASAVPSAAAAAAAGLATTPPTISWDPPPLPPRWFLPLQTARNFTCGHEAVTLSGWWGRTNNILLELVHMLAYTVSHEPPLVLVLQPRTEQLVADRFDLRAATAGWACVRSRHEWPGTPQNVTAAARSTRPRMGARATSSAARRCRSCCCGRGRRCEPPSRASSGSTASTRAATLPSTSGAWKPSAWFALAASSAIEAAASPSAAPPTSPPRTSATCARASSAAPSR